MTLGLPLASEPASSAYSDTALDAVLSFTFERRSGAPSHAYNAGRRSRCSADTTVDRLGRAVLCTSDVIHENVPYDELCQEGKPLEAWTLETVDDSDEKGDVWQWSDEQDILYDEGIARPGTTEEHSVSEPNDDDIRHYLLESTDLAYYDNVREESGLDVPATPPGPATIRLGEAHDDLFISLSRNRFNLCIDSVDPDVAPHTVISPPDFSWHDYYTPSYNSVGYQWSTHLMVPAPGYYGAAQEISPTPVGPTGNSTEQSWETSQEIVHIPGLPADDWLPTSLDRSRRRRTTRCSRKDARARERHSFPAIVAVLLRHCYRACLSTIIDKVPSLRLIYDDPAWDCAADRPFHWTDPGQALLEQLRPFRGITVLDSTCPLRAPHIALAEPWPEAPWTALANAAPCPQDAGAGATLCVPGVPAVNEAEAWGGDGAGAPEDAYEGMAEYFEGAGEGVDAVWEAGAGARGGGEGRAPVLVFDAGSGGESRPDTPAPDTPQDAPLEFGFEDPPELSVYAKTAASEA